MYIHTYTHVYTHVYVIHSPCAHVHRHDYIHTDMSYIRHVLMCTDTITSAYAHVYTRIYIYIHICINLCLHMYIYTYIHTYIHPRTQIPRCPVTRQTSAAPLATIQSRDP